MDLGHACRNPYFVNSFVTTIIFLLNKKIKICRKVKKNQKVFLMENFSCIISVRHGKFELSLKANYLLIVFIINIYLNGHFKRQI